MEEIEVDVAIIGSGTAGLNAMGRVRHARKSFVLINGGEAGTTCARVGCMPSKVIIQVAEDFHRRTVFSRCGIEGGDSLRVNLPKVMEYVQDIRDTFVDRVLSHSTDHLSGAEFIQEYAHFIEPTQLQIGNDKRVRAKAVVIATGSTPIVPEAWRAFGDRVLTTDEFFEQETLPQSMAVIGLGVIGLELGQAIRRLGVEVTGIDLAETIGGLSDPAVAKQALDIMSKEFPIWLGAAAELSETDDGRIRVRAGDNEVVVDKVLAAMGRRPNLDHLNIEALGVPLDDKGVPLHDEHTGQVGELPVFIAGDVNGHRPILHEAGDEGKIAGHNAAHYPEITAFRRKQWIGITFCDPNIITVGKRFEQLDEATTAIGEMPVAPVGRALIMAKNRGLIRLYADKISGRFLGAEMIAPAGEHLAHLLVWALENQMTVGAMLRMPFYHPVMEEAVQAALNSLYAKVEHKNDGPLTELAPL
ncbi:MAG TPA: dihydrolipoyl dehydrogenase [Gammaproteobacteria bacterium]|nr:dihydrolipoyl dehydrogenase [Gammaproteobacteria bacterium]